MTRSVTTDTPVIDGGLLDELLEKTSRTFALAIPLLPQPLRREVGVGYLLLRVADTLEDAERWGRDRRIEQLAALIEAFQTRSPELLAEAWAADPASDNDDYNRLLRHAPEVFAALGQLETKSAELIVRHTTASARGMAETLARADEAGRLELGSIEELRRYCYYVAGVVGEMLTALFQRRLAVSDAASRLGDHARAFGEGLQLVNILKDAGEDARDGRAYLPIGSSRDEVIGLARGDLEAAAEYADLLQEAGADPGVIAFATLPRTLAVATLDALESGEATKVDREVVGRLFEEARALAPGSGLAPGRGG